MEIITASRHIFDDDSIDENHESFHKEEEESKPQRTTYEKDYFLRVHHNIKIFMFQKKLSFFQLYFQKLIFNELEINFLTVIIEIEMIIIFFK